MSKQPPKHLSARSKKLWGELVPARAQSPERQALLQLGLEALDRADQARKILDRDGLTTKNKTTGVVHVHPLIRTEKDARKLFVRIWSELSLEWRFDIDGRRG